MAQPSHIELQAGDDRFYRVTALLIWLISATAVIFHMNNQHWMLSVTGCFLLLALWLISRRCMSRDRRLRLYCNGAAAVDGHVGHWGTCYWSSRWYTLLRMDLACGRSRVLVAASRNHPDDYRRLLVWVRFSPFDTTGAIGHRIPS